MTDASGPSRDHFRDDEATVERAAAAIRMIAAALDQIAETSSPSGSARVFRLAFGWFAAVVRTAQVVALAHENGLLHESAASARLVLQHPLALQWLAEGGDPAVDAVEADGQRRAFDLVKELADTRWPLPAGFTMQPSARLAQSGALEHQIANFKAMCELYDGGGQLYVPYRLQSGNAHPSYVGAMAYIVPETGEVSANAITDTYAYLLDTTRCVVQAGHAFAPLLADTVLADAVTRAEGTLGIAFPLWQRIP